MIISCSVIRYIYVILLFICLILILQILEREKEIKREKLHLYFDYFIIFVNLNIDKIIKKWLLNFILSYWVEFEDVWNQIKLKELCLYIFKKKFILNNYSV